LRAVGGHRVLPYPNPAIAHIYGSGVTVQNVTSGSPAEEAGLKVGDTIIAWMART